MLLNSKLDELFVHKKSSNELKKIDAIKGFYNSNNKSIKKKYFKNFSIKLLE